MAPLRSMKSLRVAFALLIVVSAVPVADAYLEPTPQLDDAPDASEQANAGRPTTVATVDGVGPGMFLALDARGRIHTVEDEYNLYHDVDPSPAGRWTVTYVASEFDGADSPCGSNESCIHNVVERVNLTTGETTRLYGVVDRQQGSSQIHDVDRVNGSVLLVGDIGPPDRVYMVNTTTGETIWEWRASEAYEPSSGGSYPGDWTHLNDVAVLPDGRVMVSLRNQDQVVFLEPGSGLQESWTLGTDDDHETLYEQHNPDYIPEARGGPAVLVADSENNRVVEYQRENGSWNRTWTWRDEQLQWPRDADRLPNGNTLVVDSHGNRILEVTPAGSVVATRSMPDGGYDAERLGTGLESATGWSTAAIRDGRAPNATFESNGSAADARLQEEAGGVLLDRFALAVTSLLPPLVLHGLLYALPGWVDAPAVVGLVAGALVALAWAAVETLNARYWTG